MSSYLSSLVLVVFVGGLCAQDFKPIQELPADIPTCGEKDLNLNDCIKDAFQKIIPRIKDGIPELNIPPMDPFVLEKSTYEYSSGAVQGRVSLRNTRVYGLSEAQVQSVNFELKDDKMNIEIKTYLPALLVEGYYKADMKINDLRMSPKGFFNVSMSDINITANPEGEIYEKDGHKYLKLTKFDNDPEVGDMRIYASGLFPDPSLNSLILDFVNQYWREIYKSLLPETRSTWEPLMLARTNEFFAALPLDLILTKE